MLAKSMLPGPWRTNGGGHLSACVFKGMSVEGARTHDDTDGTETRHNRLLGATGPGEPD